MLLHFVTFSVVVDILCRNFTKPLNNKFRSGVCACAEGFARDDKGKCVATSPATSLPPPPPAPPALSTSEPPPKLLTVTVMAKNVTLPDNSAELIAAVLPEAPEGTKYQVILYSPINESTYHDQALEESWSWTISPLFMIILRCGTCIKSRTTGAANSKLFLHYFL